MDGITFGTLNRDGTVTNTRVIKHTDIVKCPRFILVPEHYKANGTCLCFDADHQAGIKAERKARREKYMKLAARQKGR